MAFGQAGSMDQDLLFKTANRGILHLCHNNSEKIKASGTVAGKLHKRKGPGGSAWQAAEHEPAVWSGGQEG